MKYLGQLLALALLLSCATARAQQITPSGGGSISSGTVTSVTATGDNIFDSSTPSAAVTSSGTVTLTAKTQTGNCVFSSPSNGSSGAPSCRSLVGADIPNPSASTLGGIESLASTAHQWINAVSTSGVPSATQPAFTDISGSATAAQLPTVVPPLQPFGPIYTSDTAGNIFPNFYAGAGGNASPEDVGLGLKASFSADVTAQMRFMMPPTIPTGTLKLRTLCMANMTSTKLEFTVKDGAVSTVASTANTSGGTSPSAVSLASETESTDTWGSADADMYKENKIALTTTPTGGQMLVVGITYDHTNSTNSATVTCLQPAVIWE
jgi:hypothetical protein